MKKIIVLILAVAFIGVSFVLWQFSGGTNEAPIDGVSTDVLPYTPPAIETPVKLLTDEVDPTPEATFARVLDALYLDVYDTYTCEAVGPNEMTLLVTAKYTPNADGLNTLDEAKAAVLAWEPRMLMDVGHLIFPREQQGSFVSPVTFAAVPGTGMRTAQVEIDGKPMTVAYSWLLNYVLFSTSLDCLEATMEMVYEHEV